MYRRESERQKVPNRSEKEERWVLKYLFRSKNLVGIGQKKGKALSVFFQKARSLQKAMQIYTFDVSTVWKKKIIVCTLFIWPRFFAFHIICQRESFFLHVCHTLRKKRGMTDVDKDKNFKRQVEINATAWLYGFCDSQTPC